MKLFPRNGCGGDAVEREGAQVRAQIVRTPDGGTAIVNPRDGVGKLGGPERAVPKLALYLRLPDGIARGRWAAAVKWPGGLEP